MHNKETYNQTIFAHLYERIAFGMLVAHELSELQDEDAPQDAFITAHFNQQNFNGFDEHLALYRDVLDCFAKNNFDLHKTVAEQIGQVFSHNAVEEIFEDQELDITLVDHEIENLIKNPSSYGRSPEILSSSQRTQHVPSDILREMRNNLAYLNLILNETYRTSSLAEIDKLNDLDEEEEEMQDALEQSLYGMHHAYQYIENAIDDLILLTKTKLYITADTNFFAPSSYANITFEANELN